ncbi:GNAT family N-acetyltransferase [Phaeovulum sp. W22_SRMD_FR3]|uniref:GNAT family N-acetyltransferase n=1 Tax=Phaeovulum sp. W22_SRMD_FR3 TaxID=3240274 RepID=UPI003F9EAF7E
MQDAVEITVLSSLDEITAEDWDACAAPECADGGRPFDPFTTHRFLHALEASGSVGPGTGWAPHPMVARRGGQIIAVAPLYLKTHSQGEYIFDHGWADALERAGGRYYPKLQCAVPFSPVTGRRLLCRPGHESEGRAALLQGMAQLADQAGLSSVHVTFCTEDELPSGEASDYLHRVTQQFHWENRGYRSYDDFLAALSSRKRKALRKERAQAQGFGGTIRQLTGAEILPEHWDAFWHFYQDTGARKWGQPYLTRAFFDIAAQTLSEDCLLVLAERDGRPVAGALNLIGRETLFGRYWGCVEDHPSLHFELCYHQAIDWALAQGLKRVEAGAQGEHKLARGYLPSPIHSLHWIAHPGFRRAVADYLDHEMRAMDDEMEALTAYGPFRKSTEEEMK